MIAYTQYSGTLYDAGSSMDTSHCDGGTCGSTTTFYRPFYIYGTARYCPDEIIENLIKYSGPPAPFSPFTKYGKTIAIKPWQHQHYYGRR